MKIRSLICTVAIAGLLATTANAQKSDFRQESMSPAMNAAPADTTLTPRATNLNIDFEAPTYAPGSISGQDGWRASLSCTDGACSIGAAFCRNDGDCPLGETCVLPGGTGSGLNYICDGNPALGCTRVLGDPAVSDCVGSPAVLCEPNPACALGTIVGTSGNCPTGQHLISQQDPNDPGSFGSGHHFAFSPFVAVPLGDRSLSSLDINVVTSGGADYDIQPQNPSNGFLNTRVKFLYTFGLIYIINDPGTGPTFSFGGFFTPGACHTLVIDQQPGTNGSVGQGTADYYLDGNLILAGAVWAGSETEEVLVRSDNGQAFAANPAADVADVDNLQILHCPPGVTGACCDGTSCSDLDECDCLLAGGAYQGDGSACGAAATCCTGGVCVDTDAVCCAVGGGTPGAGNCEGDADGDLTDGSCGDACPTEPTLLAPGVCGCDVTDTDSDTILDCVDNCVNDSNVAQTNNDTDSHGDACDNCDFTDNDPQTDTDGDGVGDACDNCIDDVNPFQEDNDSDGAGNACEECDDDPNKLVPGICGCGVADVGDSDGDGFLDCVDQCNGVDDAVFAPGCVGQIPTVSEWGLVVLALLLLVAGKVYFGRRPAMS